MRSRVAPLIAAALLCASVAHARAPLRVFMDLSDAEAVKAWQKLNAAAPRTEFAWTLHPLPLSRNPNSRAVAAALLHARAQGAALAFADALMTAGGRVNAQLWRRLKLKPPTPSERALLGARVEAERRAAIRFGVRASPSLLWCGLAQSGVNGDLNANGKVAQRRWRACERRGESDCELHFVGREGVAARAALRRLRVVAQGLDSGRRVGRLGQRWRVTLPDLPSTKRLQAPTVLVWFVDPERRLRLSNATSLLRAIRRQRLQVVALPLPAPGASLGLSARLLATLNDPDPAARQVNLKALIEGEKTPEEAMSSTQRETIERRYVPVLHEIAQVASGVSAQPGAMFFNGRRWLGDGQSLGLPQAVDIARSYGGVPYNKRVASGRWRPQAARDLGPPLKRPPFDGLWSVRRPDKGKRWVSLLLDPQRWASRAAYFATLTLTRERGMGLRVFVAGPTGPMAAQAAACGTLSAWLKASISGGKGRLKPCKTKPDGRQLPPLRRLTEELGATREAVIYIGRRRYLGPLDEARLRAAMEHRQATKWTK